MCQLPRNRSSWITATLQIFLQRLTLHWTKTKCLPRNKRSCKAWPLPTAGLISAHSPPFISTHLYSNANLPVTPLVCAGIPAHRLARESRPLSSAWRPNTSRVKFSGPSLHYETYHSGLQWLWTCNLPDWSPLEGRGYALIIFESQVSGTVLNTILLKKVMIWTKLIHVFKYQREKKLIKFGQKKNNKFHKWKW